MIRILIFTISYFSACFTWTNLLVVVVELDGNENEALDLIPLVTNSVLEDHYLIVGVVVVVDPGVVPINSRGEKQRMHLRDGFLSDLLDPIYVAYNMWDLLTIFQPEERNTMYIVHTDMNPADRNDQNWFKPTKWVRELEKTVKFQSSNRIISSK